MKNKIFKTDELYIWTNNGINNNSIYIVRLDIKEYTKLNYNNKLTKYYKIYLINVLNDKIIYSKNSLLPYINRELIKDSLYTYHYAYLEKFKNINNLGLLYPDTITYNDLQEYYLQLYAKNKTFKKNY